MAVPAPVENREVSVEVSPIKTILLQATRSTS
jgi:hypothetical protein